MDSNFSSFWLGPFSENPTPRLKKKKTLEIINFNLMETKEGTAPTKWRNSTQTFVLGGGGVQTYPHHKNVRVKLRHFVEQYFRSLWMIEWKNFIFTRWSFQDTKLLGWTRKGKTWSRGTNSRLAFAVNVTLNREIKHHVYVKWQTQICTTWPSFLFTCRLLFIISTPKLVVSLDFSSIRIVLSCYYLLIFYFENFST